MASIESIQEECGKAKRSFVVQFINDATSNLVVQSKHSTQGRWYEEPTNIEPGKQIIVSMKSVGFKSGCQADIAFRSASDRNRVFRVRIDNAWSTKEPKVNVQMATSLTQKTSKLIHFDIISQENVSGQLRAVVKCSDH
mmetsp:Transcript_1583/g.1775  ORF Transcript_1583/g.1775 Transcript_1583/m.1775 type:complete len:139 (+) Transcript_1583:129-545(+)|eukprot:CAMPEP_0168519234 /NCGR_PEP_ID=MMETSP0405-20121227/7194_1 /TAXON_ID=498012 /ORGANISM="Trichosphaerium sp, Strain Am-I-7 wt" /LENGTH=138 /DNA_ID=CAMNT_0008539733 /DNA_START=114 /DNA_END=530 /DNA_ORIENTATION=+